MLEYIYQSLPIIVCLVVWAVRLEVRIAKIQTDIGWLKQERVGCQPPLDKSTP